MSEDLKSVDNVISDFNLLIDVFLEGITERRKTVIGGRMLGCPTSIPRYSSVELDGIREAVEDAKAVFAGKIVLSAEGINGNVCKNELVELVSCVLENKKYYGDPDDPEPYAYNNAIDEIIKIILNFVKDLEI